MTFELVFGKGTTPGSKEVYSRILSLNDRLDVDRLRREVRSRVSGGERANERRQSRVKELEALARQQKHEGKLEEAYLSLMKASDIQGCFTSSILRETYEILVALKRYEEAAAIAYIGKHCYGEFFGAQLVEIYRLLGYCNHNSCAAGKGCRVMDNADLSETLSRILAMNDESAGWSQHLFLFTHANYHLKMRREEAYEFLAKKTDFVSKLEENETLMALFDSVNFAAMELFEIHALALFFKLIRHMGSADKANMMEAMQQSWYFPLLRRMSRSLVAPKTLARFARCQSEAFDVLLHEWILSIWPMYRPIFLGDDTLDTKFPFDSFEWYCRVGALIFFAEGHFQEDGPFGVINVANFFARMLGEALDNNNRLMALDAGRLSSVKWAKAFDLFLLVSAVSFAEWKSNLLERRNSQFMDVDELETVTNKRLLIISLNAQFKLIVKLKQTPVPSYIMRQTSFFVYLAARLVFLVANLPELAKIMGECALTSTIGCMTVLLIDHRITHHPSQVERIFECPEFCQFFAMSLFMLTCSGMVFPTAKVHLPAVMRIVAISGTAAPSRFLNDYLLNDQGPPLAHSLFALQFMGAFNTECLAMLLRGANDASRRRWVDMNYPFFQQTALILVDCLIGNNNITSLENCITTLTTFHAIIGRSPPMVSLGHVFEANERGLDRLQRLVEKLATLMSMDVVVETNSSSSTLPCNTDAELRPIFVRICKIAAGLVAAALCQVEPRFAKCLQRPKMLKPFVSQMRQLVN